eukprot:CFRG7610T1
MSSANITVPETSGNSQIPLKHTDTTRTTMLKRMVNAQPSCMSWNEDRLPPTAIISSSKDLYSQTNIDSATGEYPRATASAVLDEEMRKGVTLVPICWQMLAVVSIGFFAILAVVLVFINLVWIWAVAALYVIETTKWIDVFELSETVSTFTGVVAFALSILHFSQDFYFFFLESVPRRPIIADSKQIPSSVKAAKLGINDSNIGFVH